jgi:hypothetical protein
VPGRVAGQNGVNPLPVGHDTTIRLPATGGWATAIFRWNYGNNSQSQAVQSANCSSSVTFVQGSVARASQTRKSLGNAKDGGCLR